MAELLHFPPVALELENEAEPQAASSPPDAEARTLALDIHRSFIVEAPAGSGKTGLLIQRYLKLLADPSVAEPEQVLAITFTLKATAEMHNRVLAQLEQAAQAPEPPATLDPFARTTRLLAASVLSRDQALGWNLLANPHRLKIRTIDAVCAEIARTLPILSGSGGCLRPTTDADPLFREAARRTLLLLGGPDTALNHAIRDLLLHRDGNLANCEQLLADMLALRDQWGDLIPLTNPQLDDATLDATVLPRLERALEHAICVVLTRFGAFVPPEFLDDLTDLASEFAELDGYKGGVSPIAFCAGLRQPPGAKSDHLAHWRALIHLLVTPSSSTWRKKPNKSHLRFESEKYHNARLEALIERVRHRDDLLKALCRIDSLPDAKYPANQWSVAKSLFRVLSRALVELQFVFAEQNQCDFTELSLLARHALDSDSGPEDLAAALGFGLQHLLVDEMQDTSTTQYHLIQLLTQAWDGHSQTVFLVGDPRQSIYLFRQARVERFLATMHARRLGDLPLTHLRLTANFRSQRALVDDFNHDFSLVFPSQSETSSLSVYQPACQPAEPVLPASPGVSDLQWHIDPVAPQDPSTAGDTSSDSAHPQPLTPAHRRQQQAIRNARHIRRVAMQWLARPLTAHRRKLPDGTPEPWRIAVLVRGRAHLAEIVAAFKSTQNGSSVPYRAVEIDPLQERQEILDLTALTRALLHPGDRVATLAILRAPWCGLSLADLHTLTNADEATSRSVSIERIMHERGPLLPAESRQRLDRVARILAEAATQRARLTTSQLVERTWRSLGGDAWLSPLELTNTRRFFQLLDVLEAESEAGAGRIDSAVLETRLRRLYAEPAQFPPDAAFVDLLTIHNAKGLEWDVVFVPALERIVGRNFPRLLTWEELDPDANDQTDQLLPIMLAPIAARGDEADALTKWLRVLHADRETAERKRLFYVACTRAREELHLFAAPQISAKGEVRPLPTSLLEAAWPAAEPHSSNAMVAETRIPLFIAPPAPEPFVLDLAASASAIAGQRQPLSRLPLHFNPAARLAANPRLPYGTPTAESPSTGPSFTRPEGSFAARSFGNAVHTFLELLATRIAAGNSPTSLLTQLPAWTPRIASILRADGLPQPTVDRFTRETRAALENVLRDPDGLWLLSRRAASGSELALTAWQDRLSTVRIDRTFQAGPAPHVPGEDFLWIVDFKTTSHGNANRTGFLATQQSVYAPQLEAYAAILAPPDSNAPETRKIRLALYYPSLPHLHWWEPLPPFRLT